LKIKILILLSFLPLVLFAEANEEFEFLHSASFSFHKGIPHIRAHIGSYDPGVRFDGVSSFDCNGVRVEAKSVTVKSKSYIPADVRHKIILQELSHDEQQDYSKTAEKWKKSLGEEVELYVHGALFSINKSTVDNREYFIALKRLFGGDEAETKLRTLRGLYPDKPITSFQVMQSVSHSEIEATTDDGKKYNCTDLLEVFPENEISAGGAGFPKGHYFLTVSEGGRIDFSVEAAVDSLIERILPGEMFLSAPLETLKAQAIAARTDIFMQLGKRHLNEPWHICSEVHCQKIIWNGRIQDKFREAVAQTAGMVITHNGNHVARAPYCSSAGGRTEDIRNVWFTAEKPYLSGVWDGEKPLKLDLSREQDLKKFLETDYGEDNLPMNRRHRWRVVIPSEKLDAMVNSYKKIGILREIRALARGVSGRIYKAEFVGSLSSFVMYGELNIRKLLNNMYSSAFVATRSEEGWVFEGMGWGHGVGMSQMGAVSLGKKGKKYDQILKRYYPGVEIIKLY